MPDFDPPAHRARSYGREELLQLRSADVTLQRPVRKAIFSCGLWLPRHQRNSQQHKERKQQLIATTAHATVPPSTLRGTPSSTSTKLGLRNARSVVNVNKRRGAPRAKSPLRCGWLNARSLSNKTSAVHDTIDDWRLDVLAVTETWHHSSDDLSLRLSVPPDYAVADVARVSAPGHGGVAVFYRRHFTCTRIAVPALSTFECL